MPPPADTTVQDVILDRINEVHGAVNEVRRDLISYSQQVVALTEWRKSVEPQIALVQTHSKELDGYGGALRALRWAGALLVGALGALEALFHLGGSK